MDKTTCASFLSCKYHSFLSQNVHRRIAELKNQFPSVDIVSINGCRRQCLTITFSRQIDRVTEFDSILAWTEEGATEYLVTYKALDGNDASLIQ